MDEETALALLDAHVAAGEQLAAQAARWQAQVAILCGEQAGPPLPADAALALLAAHHGAEQAYATQNAAWADHLDTLFPQALKPDPLTDPAIQAYYQSARPAKPTPSRQNTRKAREKKAWELLRQKVLATASPAAPEQPPLPPTRSKPMATPDDTTDPQLPIDWDTRPEHAAATAAAEQAHFDQAKARTLHADPATLDRAGTFARSQALADINKTALAAAMAAPLATLTTVKAPWFGHMHIDRHGTSRSPDEGVLERTRPAPGQPDPFAAARAAWERQAQEQENTIEPAASAAPADRQTQLLKGVIGNASLMMTAPTGDVDPAMGATLAADDIAALNDITEAHLRTTALLAVAESRHAQPHYQAAFDRQAPALAAEVDTAVVTRFGDDYAPRRNASTATANAARQQAHDAAALDHVAAARAKDRQQIAQTLGWNTLERADAPAAAPAQPTAINPAKPPSADATTVPHEVARAFLHVGNKFYMPKNKARVAFEDHGLQIKTVLNDTSIALAMVQIAHARGWQSIKVTGTPEFRHDAWREAALRGLAVQGYTPSELDKADLARRMPQQPKPATATPAPVPAPAGTPATADTLIAHGPAKYQHKPENADSYYVTVANQQGKQRTIWGVNLGTALAESGARIGDQITLAKNGEQVVTVDEKIKNDAGAVVGSRKVGAVRNAWTIKAHAAATQPAAQVAQAHPDLAGALAIPAIIDRRAAADGFTAAQRAIIAARAQQNMVNSIERGAAPTVKLREAATAQQQPRQELAQ